MADRGSLGVKLFVEGVVDYAQTGDATNASRTAGGVAFANLTQAAGAKVMPKVTGTPKGPVLETATPRRILNPATGRPFGAPPPTPKPILGPDSRTLNVPPPALKPILGANGEPLNAPPPAPEPILGQNGKTLIVPKTPPKPGTLSEVQARKWYHEQLDPISKKISPNLSKEQQFRQTTKWRNQAKRQARDLMADRADAAELDVTDPIRPPEYYIEKGLSKGLEGDALWVY